MYKIIGGDQKEYGPVAADQLRQWIAEGRADGRTLVQAEGGVWKPLSTFPEFASSLGSTFSSAPPLPGQAPPLRSASSASANIPNYLVQAILCTICCCLPFGIVAIIYAAQVNSKLAGGDVQGATDSSRKARIWCWVSLISGAIAGILWAVIQFILVSGVNRF